MWSWLKTAFPGWIWGAGPQGTAFYDLFLETVIRVPEVQRWRERAAELEPNFERDIAPFFDSGCIPGDTTSRRFLWSLDPDNPPAPFPDGGGYRLSEPTVAAWEVAFNRFANMMGGFQTGDRRAIGVHPLTGSRRELTKAEWNLQGRYAINVMSGDLILKNGKDSVAPTPVWNKLEILAPALPTLPQTGKVIWDDLLAVLVEQRENDKLPPRKAFVAHVKNLVTDRYGQATLDESELQRFVKDLYDGASLDELKAKRKRKR